MKRKLYEYEQELTGYFLVTKIRDYLDAEVEPSELPSRDPNTFVDTVKTYIRNKLAKFTSKFWSFVMYRQQSLDELSLKVKAKVTEKTLLYVNELWDSLAYQVQLPVTALLFDKIAEGCVNITWLIPFHLTHFTTRRLQESTNYFREQNIIRVTIAGRCIYDEPPPVQVSTRKERPKEKSVTIEFLLLNLSTGGIGKKSQKVYTPNYTTLRVVKLYPNFYFSSIFYFTHHMLRKY